MKKIWFACIFLLIQMNFAYSSKTIVCTMQDANNAISFTTSEKMGDLPTIDFSYPVKTILFSIRSGNLLLVAMDSEEKTRPRIMISAQTTKNSSVYKGQFITDNGGNEIQLDNGPVSCRLK